MLRVSELCNTNVGDLDGPDGVGMWSLNVRGKGGAQRRIPLSPTVSQTLLDHWREYRHIDGPRDKGKENLPLLVNSHGMRWTRHSLTCMIRRTAARAGITRFKVSAHKLRHTAATIAVHAGVNLRAVSTLLNHSNLQATERYIHLIPGTLHAARAQQRAGLQACVGAVPEGASNAH